MHARLDALKHGPARERPPIVCLCGSTRFIEEMAVLAWEFEKDGIMALGPHLLPKSYTDGESHLAELEGVKATLDDLHLRKIDLADSIFVVNLNGYIGESTRAEIEYATKLGKAIEYAEMVP